MKTREDPDPDQVDDQTRRQLAEIRKRCRRAWAMWLGMFITVVAVLPLVWELGFRHVIPLGYFLLAVQMAFCVFYTVRFNKSRCPRCGNFFFSDGAWLKSYARHCLHCHLPLKPPKR